jgi:hypothetical protein
MVEGVIMVIIDPFIYIWAQNALPSAGPAQGVCNSSVEQLGHSLLGGNAIETYNKVNVNADIIDKGPLFGNAVAFTLPDLETI